MVISPSMRILPPKIQVYDWTRRTSWRPERSPSAALDNAQGQGKPDFRGRARVPDPHLAIEAHLDHPRQTPDPRRHQGHVEHQGRPAIASSTRGQFARSVPSTRLPRGLQDLTDPRPPPQPANLWALRPPRPSCPPSPLRGHGHRLAPDDARFRLNSLRPCHASGRRSTRCAATASSTSFCTTQARRRPPRPGPFQDQLVIEPYRQRRLDQRGQGRPLYDTSMA